MTKIEELRNALIIKRAELWVMWTQVRIKEREEIQLVAALRALEQKESEKTPSDSSTAKPLDLGTLNEAALERYRVGKQQSESAGRSHGQTLPSEAEATEKEDDSHGDG